MSWQTTYRNSQVGGASPIGLVIALFDRLVADLTRAADAIRSSDIERRCREINHALVVIGQLESWIDRNKGGDAAQQLEVFYAQIRARAMQASLEQRPELLEEQIASILNVRTSWQQLDSSPGVPAPGYASSTAFAANGETRSAGGRVFSQSA